jgi:hypothetical protein
MKFMGQQWCVPFFLHPSLSTAVIIGIGVSPSYDRVRLILLISVSATGSKKQHPVYPFAVLRHILAAHAP